MYIIYDISRAVQEDSIIEVILTPVTRGFLFVCVIVDLFV